MYPVSQKFLAALRSGYGMETLISAHRGGERLDVDLRIDTGSVSYSSGTGVRAKLDVTFAPSSGLWDALAPIGTTLEPTWVMRFPDGSTENVPLGTFDIDEQSLSYTSSGGIHITAPDLWVRVQRQGFTEPEITTGNIVYEAVRLVTDVIPGIKNSIADPQQFAGTAVWESDRADAVNKLVTSAGFESFIDRTGILVARKIPDLSNVPVWTVDHSLQGVLVSATRTRSRQRVYNAVTVRPSQNDGTYFTPVTISDGDVNSPTWIGGPFGVVPFVYSSPVITSYGQATTVATSLLHQATGFAASVTLSAAPNPALDPGDVITVVYPPRDGSDLLVERHIIDTHTVSLTPGEVQPINTRSSRPDGDLPSSN